MRISVKCSSAVHMLLMIAARGSAQKITSDLLASSLGCNPVEVRRLLSSLKKAGIIDVPRGQGGATLRRPPDEITLLDVYAAVDSASLDELIGIHNHPAPQCPFGRNIEALLAEPYTKIGNAVRETMQGVTLMQLLSRLHELEPDLQTQ